MKQPIDISQLLQSLPLEFMARTAEELKVDYKVKKLQAIRVFSLLLIGFIRQNEISQRKICEQASSIWLDEFLNTDIDSGTVSHSSLSERLVNIKSEYFARVYYEILRIAEEKIGSDALEDSNIIRIDTTLVAETSAKLSEGINTGVNNRFGGQKKHIKYGMAYDGFSAVLAKIFTQQQASGEEIALGKTVLDTARHIAKKGSVLVFDRGTTAYDTLCDLKEIAREKGCHFISRLKLNRKYSAVENYMGAGKATVDNEFEIMQDCKATLNRPSKSKHGIEQFRIIKVRFLRPRPRTLPSAKKRRYEPQMLLITDDFETDALTLVHEYKKRWSIEVFYKFLKQNLSFSHILTTNRNGIEVLLYMTLITAVLVKLYAIANGLGLTIAQSRMVVQLENWIYTHQIPAPKTKYSKSKKHPPKYRAPSSDR